MSEFEKAKNYLQIALSSAAQSGDDYGVNQSGYYEISAAIKALNKQIPTKPEYEGDGYDENGNLIYDMLGKKQTQYKILKNLIWRVAILLSSF